MTRFYGSFLVSWLQNYDEVQNVAVYLLYFQVCTGIVGSIGPMYAGLLAADTALALFGLVAVASGYQALGRSYAVLLVLSLICDGAWIHLYSSVLWQKREPPGWEVFEITPTFTSRLELICHVAGFINRLFSGILWLQMFRLGIPIDYRTQSPAGSSIYSVLGDLEQPWRAGSSHMPVAGDLSPHFARQSSANDEFLGSAIFHPGALFRSGHLENYVIDEGHTSDGHSVGKDIARESSLSDDEYPLRSRHDDAGDTPERPAEVPHQGAD